MGQTALPDSQWTLLSLSFEDPSRIFLAAPPFMLISILWIFPVLRYAVSLGVVSQGWVTRLSPAGQGKVIFDWFSRAGAFLLCQPRMSEPLSLALFLFPQIPPSGLPLAADEALMEDVRQLSTFGSQESQAHNSSMWLIRLEEFSLSPLWFCSLESHTNPLFLIVFLASIKLQSFAWIGLKMLWLRYSLDGKIEAGWSVIM